MTLHLVLTFHWYDEHVAGRKTIEYRQPSERWMRLIHDRRDQITHVRFARGYTSTTTTFCVSHIDLGPCPIPGWVGDYIRIHFNQGET